MNRMFVFGVGAGIRCVVERVCVCVCQKVVGMAVSSVVGFGYQVEEGHGAPVCALCREPFWQVSELPKVDAGPGIACKHIPGDCIGCQGCVVPGSCGLMGLCGVVFPGDGGWHSEVSGTCGDALQQGPGKKVCNV